MNMNINVPADCEYPEAYIRAAKGRIRANAAKGRAKRWLATEEGRRAKDFLMGTGEFCTMIGNVDVDSLSNEALMHLTYDKGFQQVANPLRQAAMGDFFWKMHESVLQWGALTEGQTNAVLKMIDRAQELVERRAKAREEQAARSQWIGEIKERRVFDLTIRHIHHMTNDWGYSGLYIMEDAEENVVIYKGSSDIGQKGETVKIKATIKAHDDRDGVKQTIITRPAKV